jgi:acetyl esterase/lipase
MALSSRTLPFPALAATLLMLPLLIACGGKGTPTPAPAPTATATTAAAPIPATRQTAASAPASTATPTLAATAAATSQPPGTLGAATQAAAATQQTGSAAAGAGNPSQRNVLGKVDRDVTYCTVGGVDLKMDIYYPRGGTAGTPQRAAAAQTPTPVVMQVHGGGWTEGEKSDGQAALVVPPLVSHGYLVASVDYRLAPQYEFPAQIEDVKCAVRFLKANAAKYNIDPNRFGVIGDSAGGHLVSLLGLTDKSAGWDVGQYLDQSSSVRVVVDLFGPADLNAPEYRTATADFARVFGTAPDAFAKASPVTYVTPNAPPFLILQGDQDDLVPLSQSQELADQLTAAGASAQLVVVKNAGHGLAPTGKAKISPSLQELSSTVADFLDRTLGKS